METINLKEITAKIIFVFAVILIISLSCTAQSVWDSKEVKANKTVFFCEKDSLLNFISIRNNNYIDPRETRMQYINDKVEFSFISLIAHDPFLEAFKESFSNKRIEDLASINDYITIFMNVDEKAQILNISFSLKKGTTIFPEEIEKLEQELLSKAKFIVVGKKIKDLIFYVIAFRIRFAEIKNGEIRMVRGSVNLKDWYKKHYENN